MSKNKMDVEASQTLTNRLIDELQKKICGRLESHPELKEDICEVFKDVKNISSQIYNKINVILRIRQCKDSKKTTGGQVWR